MEIRDVVHVSYKTDYLLLSYAARELFQGQILPAACTPVQTFFFLVTYTVFLTAQNLC